MDQLVNTGSKNPKIRGWKDSILLFILKEEIIRVALMTIYFWFYFETIGQILPRLGHNVSFDLFYIFFQGKQKH